MNDREWGIDNYNNEENNEQGSNNLVPLNNNVNYYRRGRRQDIGRRKFELVENNLEDDNEVENNQQLEELDTNNEIEEVKQVEAAVNDINKKNGISSMIDGNLLPLFFFMKLMNKNDFPLNINNDEILKFNNIVKSIIPYFDYDSRYALTKIENILDVVQSVNGLMNKEYVNKAKSIQKLEVDNKPISMLEAIRPHMEGNSRDGIERILTINEKVNRLKNNTGDSNFMGKIEDVADILDALKIKKGSEIKSYIAKFRMISAILKQSMELQK